MSQILMKFQSSCKIKACCIILVIGLMPTSAFAADYVLILGGAAGEKSFYDAFWSATSRFHQLLLDEYDYTPEQITFLFEDSGDATTNTSDQLTPVDAQSKREQVLTTFTQLAENLQTADQFILFMLGHASRTPRRELKFNLKGRDITEAEYVTLINRIPAERQILIFAFPYSGSLVQKLSRPGRIILTSSSQKEGYSLQAGFGELFVDAFLSADNDANRDGDISLLEAFLALQTRTQQWYENNGTFQSEHPHLDDNGDGNATRNFAVPENDTIPETAEGALAEKTFLGTRRSVLQSSPTPPEQEPEAPNTTEKQTLHPTTADAPEQSGLAPPSSDGHRNLEPTRLPYDYISPADEAIIQAAIDKPPTQEKYPQHGAVILWESVDVDIDEKSRYIYSTRRVAKIFNEDGKSLTEVSIPYMRGRDDVTIHHARTLTPDGKSIDLDLSEVVRDIPPPEAVNAGLYVDARLMYFTFPEVTDGCIIDYAYSTNNVGHVMQGEFWRRVYFQGIHPLRYYRFTVHIPKKKQLYYQVSGTPAATTTPQAKDSFLELQPTVTEDNYSRTYTFEARDIPPLNEEYLMPAPQDLAYNISISSIDSWEKLAMWYATLIREQDTLTPRITEKTEQLLSGAWSRNEKIKRLYEYVARDIQYNGYELGIWAIKPYPADRVLELGAGDCKGKTTLLSTMLASVGIDAYPVLISAGDVHGINAHRPNGGSTVEAVPSLAYFNHMILVVEGEKPNELIWLDPTAETCAYGDFPTSDQDRWTLIINPRFLSRNKQATAAPQNINPNPAATSIQDKLYLFQKSPILAATSNLKQVQTHITVKEDMSVSVRQQLKVTGSFNTKLRSQLAHLHTSEERADLLHKMFELDRRAKIQNVKIPKLTQLNSELTLDLTWTCNEYVYAIGSQFVLELPIVKHPYAKLLSEEHRRYPAVIGKTLILQDKVTVTTEAPLKIQVVPKEQNLKTQVAEIQLRYATSKRKAEMHQTIRFLNPKVTPQNILHLKDVVRIASNRGTKRFILTQD